MSRLGARHALVVAVSNYRDPKLQKLRAPAADAERLAAVLSDRRIGDFQVEVALDEEQPELSRRIARFFSDRRPDDLLLVHFSCHGIKDDRGELYLAATDTEVGDLLSATGISSAWVNERIGRSRSKRVVVLLDCCFSGSFPFGLRSRAGDDVNVQDHLQGRGRAVITASNSIEYSYEGDQLSGEGRPSFFTDAVAEALETGKADRDQDSLISIEELYDYVFDRVREKTPSQTPTKLSSLEGPLYIARSSYRAPILPAKLDEDLVALMEHPLSGAREGAVQELSTILKSRNRGMALAARQALERMLEDDSRRVSARAEAALEGLTPEAQPPSGEKLERPPGGKEEPPPGEDEPPPGEKEEPPPEETTAIAAPFPADVWARWAKRIASLSIALLLAGIASCGVSWDKAASESPTTAMGSIFVLLAVIGLIAAGIVSINSRRRKR
jgi:hypothetical protein